MKLSEQWKEAISWKKIIFWIFSALTAIILAYSLVKNPEGTIIWSLIIFIILLISANLKHGLYLIIFIPIIGELWRLPIGLENGTPLFDLATIIFTGIWVIKKLINHKSLSKNNLYYPLLIFLSIALISLLNALSFLAVKEVLTSSLYLIRLISYISLAFITQDLIKTEKDQKNILYILFTTTLIIALTGFIQLIIYPNLANLEKYGWDPHINRLVSTWLDPNFVGGLLAFFISILTGIILYTKSLSKKFWLIILLGFLGTALFFTYSRSSYLALAAGIILIGLIKSWKIILICVIIFIIGLSISPRADERFNDLITSVNSIIYNTSENPDPTTKLRLKSYEQTWKLIKARPILGSGYNTLRYVNFNEGFVENTDIHSASGSDSSFLTIFATTGILGLLTFAWLFFEIIKKTIKKLKSSNNNIKGFELGFLGGIIALLIHSIFVNSLLFPLIMIPFWICVGILYSNPKNPEKNNRI